MLALLSSQKTHQTAPQLYACACAFCLCQFSLRALFAICVWLTNHWPDKLSLSEVLDLFFCLCLGSLKANSATDVLGYLPLACMGNDREETLDLGETRSL